MAKNMDEKHGIKGRISERKARTIGAHKSDICIPPCSMGTQAEGRHGEIKAHYFRTLPIIARG